MRKMRNIGLSLAAVAALSLGAHSVLAADQLSKTDKEYLDQATEEVLGQAALSRIADKHAKEETVRSYAHDAVEGAEKMEKELHEIADKYGYTLPAKDEWATKNDTRLHALEENPDFDKAYLDEQVKDQEEMLKLWEKASDRTDLEALKKWFGKKTSDIQASEDRAHTLREKATK